jgi:hypothetical protein
MLSGCIHKSHKLVEDLLESNNWWVGKEFDVLGKKMN